ncbi:NUDIX domain-containing protein [candidate division KSB1 bacterium]|nr:NUDIX domain-containing protein [candidate division KSB1 bacterium]
MKEEKINYWLEWARRIQAIGQSGLAFTENQYDVERYQQLMGIAAEILQEHTQISKQQSEQDFKWQKGYATPKIDVRGAVVRENKILMVQERVDRKWCLPGGWADVGDIPSAAAEREVIEESGFNVKSVKVVGVYDANRDGRELEFYHAFKIIFLCDIIDGAPKTSFETIGVDFFEFDNLPPLSSNRTNHRHLNDVQAHIQNPRKKTVFD